MTAHAMYLTLIYASLTPRCFLTICVNYVNQVLTLPDLRATRSEEGEQRERTVADVLFGFPNIGCKLHQFIDDLGPGLFRYLL